MSRLGAVTKFAIEKKKYTIGYDCWLEDAETLVDFAVSISPATTPPLIADNAYVSGDFKSVITYLSQGQVGALYSVSFIAQTSIGQQKVDQIQMRVV